MSLTALINGRVMTDHGPQSGLVVLLRGERIEAVVKAGDARIASATKHDLHGQLLLPGFIDVQVNGGGGVLFNAEPTVDALRAISTAHRKYGTTGFLPTLITDTAEVMNKALDAVDAAIEQGVPGVLGIHLEGPFLATARKGIHDASLFRLPDGDDIAAITRKRRGVVMLTLAVEEVPLSTISQLASAGVRVVAGHTAANHDVVRAALDAGVSGFTHLYNAMTPLTSREPGVVGAALDDPHSWCGLIVDGHHVHPVAMRVAIAAKAKGKMVLVTDAMPPVGSDSPEYVLNGQTIVARDGICQSDAGVLAGSALDMATGVRNLVDMVGLPLAEASRMASNYPAAWLGLERTHGRIIAGQQADFAVLDDGLVVTETWVGGVRFAV